ncbi:MAG: GNAT family N-acetyltransferase [Firmicutes bacterium]|nr:GNAT family N-acetyltransferase [Bacillota bacterium]
MGQAAAEQIEIVSEERGAKRVVLSMNGEQASECWIIPFYIRVGAAVLRMDGIGGVATKPEHRMKGYARRVMQAAVEHMSQGDACITMLYGIPDFYHRFGYVTAGPEYLVFLWNLQKDIPLPVGWSYREFTPQDLPTVQRIYEHQTAQATGTAVRSPDGRVWQQLLKVPGSYPNDECWVAVDPQGAVKGYAWRARWCWSVRDILEREYDSSLVFGEVLAECPAAADTLLVLCRRRAQEEDKREALLAVPPDSVVARAARYQDARFEQVHQANGGSMVRVLDVQRLARSMEPEWSRLVQPANWTGRIWLTLRTELGAATLRIAPGEVRVTDEAGEPHAVIDLPQGTLARLVCGLAPAEDLCARLPTPQPDNVNQLLRVLFPMRFQHMYLPDRY